MQVVRRRQAEQALQLGGQRGAAVGLECGDALLAVAGGHHGLHNGADVIRLGHVIQQQLELEVEPAHSGLEQRLRLHEAVAAAVGDDVGGEEEHGAVEVGGGAQEALRLVLRSVEEEGAAGGRVVVGVPPLDERGGSGNALFDERGGERAAVARRREGVAAC